MSMMWVKKQSKWAIIAGALLIGGSLILMDLPSSQGMTAAQSVGEVDGEEIPTMSFQQELQNMMREEEARTGRQPTGAAFAMAREQLFQYRVQNILLSRMVRDYGLRATPEEMRDWLLRNPREIAYALAQYEGPEAVPFFLRDTTVDMANFTYWMSQDSVYDRPGMRMLEERLKAMIVPQLQVQQIFRSQIHRTDLEEAFLIETREDKAALRYYHVPATAFDVSPSSFDDAALKAHFEANPDSFWFRDEAAELAYVRFALVPSAEDSALMRDFAAEIRERAAGGESFEELARSYSSDPGSAEAGGRLPPAARGDWVPAFSDVAFSLAPGALSEPVLSPFGWHIILKHGTERVDGVEKASVSHILLNITTGTETSDRIVSEVEAFKAQAEAHKDGLEGAAAAAGLPVLKTGVFEKGNLAPLGVYVQGVSSFAFSPAERKAKVSEALQSDDGVYVLARAARFAKGRDFDRAKQAVAQDLARVKRLEAARAEAEKARSVLLAAPQDAPPTIGKATLQTTEPVSSEGFAPGFGFGDPALYRVTRQNVGEWGPVVTTREGAVVALVTAKEPVPADLKAQRVRAARAEGDLFQVSNLYQQWGATLPKSAKVVNRLDEVYRD